MHTRSSRSGIRRILWILAAVAMIVAVMPLAGASAEEGDVSVVDLIVDGGTDSTTWVDIGSVTAWQDTDNLYVKYVVDVEPWCLTLTHVDVADEAPDDFAINKKGAPKIGKFAFVTEHDPCVTTHTETIPLDGMEVDYIAAHADAFIDGGFDAVDLVLPETAIMKLVRPSAAYVDMIMSGGTVLDSPPNYEGWCADEHHNISLNRNYNVSVSSSYSDGIIDWGNITPTGQANIFAVNWVVNNHDGYTMTQTQNVIWALLGDRNPPTAGAEWVLYNEALLQTDFVPECGESFLVILSSIGASYQSMVFQTTFLELGVLCEDREETAWAGVWIENGDGTGTFGDFKFVQNAGWAGYFAYPG